MFIFRARILDTQLRDVSEYLKIPIQKTIINAEIKDTVNEEILWNEKERNNIDDYRDYYSKNIHYLERQDFYNLNHPKLLSEFRNLKKNANILDYGCGTAVLALDAKKTRKDLNIFLADIPEAITKKYVIWRFNKYNLAYQWIDIPKNENIDINNKFDLIRCHDVFEHCFYPLDVIKFFYQHLNYGGILSFDYLENQVIEKEVTKQSQRFRKEVLRFVELNFDYIYSFKNKYVVKKK